MRLWAGCLDCKHLWLIEGFQDALECPLCEAPTLLDLYPELEFPEQGEES